MSPREHKNASAPHDKKWLVARATEVFGDAGLASEWLRRPLALFGGRSPLQMAGTSVGVEAVEQTLGRIEHGVFS